ncbi:nucleotide kinase domain-containing protein [Mycobacteroides abscessus]
METSDSWLLPLDLGVDDHRGAPTGSLAPITVRVAGREFLTSPVFDTYWRFAARRQSLYRARLNGRPPPWSSDPVLSAHRFTNCYRAADRVSQYLIAQVAYRGSQEPAELILRILLFKLFNKPQTWELLVQSAGVPTLDTFDVARYSAVLDDAFGRGVRLYSAAYVMPAPAMGAVRKHTNHLRLLEHMMSDGIAERLGNAESMQEAFTIIKSYPGIGDFLAFQYTIDINYSAAMQFDEMDYVVAGPGARDGIRKCFGPSSAGHEHALIEYMASSQDEHFTRLGLPFDGLFGRPLQLIDCQNLFCEVDKYARVVHPDIQGYSGRARIKQKYRPTCTPVPAWFPPKWGLNAAAAAASSAV